MGNSSTSSSTNQEMGGVWVCVVHCSERIQFKAEGRESWCIFPKLLIAAFKGIVGKADGWELFALSLSPPLQWSDTPGDGQHNFSHGQEKKGRLDNKKKKAICLGDYWFILPDFSPVLRQFLLCLSCDTKKKNCCGNRTFCAFLEEYYSFPQREIVL